MTAEELRALLDHATASQLRAVLSVAWTLDPALLGRAKDIADHAGQCTCGASVDDHGIVHAAVA